MHALRHSALPFFCVCLAHAQNIGGSITGEVADSQGLAVENAKIEIVNLTTGTKFASVSDRSGKFLVPSLAQSMYRVTAAKEGFAAATAGLVRVAIGDSPAVKLILTPIAAAQSVTVSAEVSALRSDTPDRGASYNSSLMNDLPMLGGGTGRNFRTQAYLTPGVSLSTAAHRPFAVSGARNRNNNYLVDSNDFNEAEGGLLMGRGASEQLISTEAIEGMQVLTHNFKAEHGRQNGSIVSLITKRGGNEFHGLAFNYFRNETIDARNTFDIVKPPLRGNNFGFNFGGPIRRNKTFFFVNNEWNIRRTTAAATVQTLTAAQKAQAVPAVAPLANLYPEPNVPGTNLFRANPSSGLDQSSQVFRVDHEINSTQRIFWRTTRLSAINKGATGAAFSRYESGVGPTGHSLQHAWTPSATLLNEARINYTRFDLNDDLIDPVALGDPTRNGLAGNVTVNGLTSLGHFAFMARRTAQNTFQFADDVSVNRGTHSLKAGVNIRRLQLNSGTFAPSFTGVLRFNSVGDFLAGRAASYSRNVGNPYMGLRATESNFYAQDDWRIHRRLTLNLGVRYEFNSVPREVNGLIEDRYRFSPDYNNIAPRFGFAWQAGRSNKTVVRGGYGIYYNVLELSFVGLTRFNAPRIRNFAAANPVFPDLLSTAQAGLATGLVNPQPNARQPYSQHLNLSIEREIFNPQTVLSVSYVGTLARKMPRASRPNGGDGLAQNLRPNPSVGVVNVLETAANSNYNGLQMSFQARAGKLTMRNAYTWSKFIDEVSDFPNSNTGIDRGILALDENNWRLNRAVSDFDMRHVFTTAFSYELKWGFRLQSLITAQSGRPYTLYSGTDSPFGTNNNRLMDVPGLLSIDSSARRSVVIADPTRRAQLTPARGVFGTLGRNTAVSDRTFGLNIGVHKSFALTERFHLELRAESFNLTNTVNYNPPDGLLSSPNFGQALTANDPRQTQLALRFVF